MSVGILGVNIVSEEPSSHTCDLRRAAAPTESTVAGSLAVQEKPTLALVHLTCITLLAAIRCYHSAMAWFQKPLSTLSRTALHTSLFLIVLWHMQCSQYETKRYDKD